MRIRRKYLIVLLLCLLAVAVAVPLLVHGLNRGTGVWIYDEVGGVWYRDVAVAPASEGEARRAQIANGDLLRSIPGVNRIGSRHFPTGPWAGSYGIEVGFASVKERDAAMRKGLVPPVLDGVVVVVDNEVGVVVW